MNRNGRRSILCPNCRRIISADEPRCPHCGIPRPGSRWKNNPLTRGWGSGDQLVRLILYANIAMYLLSLVISKSIMQSGFNPLNMLAPSTSGLAVLGATGTLMVRNVGWWTLVSANYLHGGALHIFFNMLAFYQIAPLITRLFGPYRFFAIYTISGVGGFAVSYVMGTPITIGASAALCGLIGAALYYGKSRGGMFGESIYKQVGGWAIAIIVLGFLIPQINNSAHIGGMVFGALSAMALGYTEKSRENMGHRILAGGCMALTLIVLLFSILRGLMYMLGT
jgi:membrane associated rhomboid family serine protease